jgi:hypothetical protein
LAVTPNLKPETQDSLTPEQRAAAWRETAKRFPDTPLLSDEAISRESMYPDRG